MLLKQLDTPGYLKSLTEAELRELATEIRQLIIDVVSQNGGHLASNLGVVELTIALHLELNLLQDSIVWDVGHQCYTHKILTGRAENFATLRTKGGISGFPKREESPFDSFNTGHSATSISGALGMALAKRLQKKPGRTVAVIGDGALTGGMAWEALNHAAHVDAPLIVILNDNEMSISPNVGAISSYLTRLRTTAFYRRAKADVSSVLQSIPRLGKDISAWARQVKDSFKYLFVKGVLFEEMGFTYLGPIDGHDIEQIRETLNQAIALEGPVVIHCLTQKGKGYMPAEKDPARFHGASPFIVASGASSSPKHGRSFTEVFAEALLRAGKADNQVVAVSAAMIDGTGLGPFSIKFPDRTYDVGIAEQHAVTLAAGLSCQGMKPVVAVYSTFLQRAYDQLLHDVSLQRLPVVFAVDRAGVVGEDGPTHHGIYDLAFLRSAPGSKIMAPVGAWDLPLLLERALENIVGPTALRYPRDIATECAPLAFPGRPTGTLLGDGNILLVGIGPLFYECLEAADLLRQQGKSVAVYYCPEVWPIPADLLQTMAGKTLVVTVEDHVLAGGFGSAVQEACCADGVPVHVVSLGFRDGFVPHAPRRDLLEQAGLTASGIVEAVKKHG